MRLEVTSLRGRDQSEEQDEKAEGVLHPSVIWSNAEQVYRSRLAPGLLFSSRPS